MYWNLLVASTKVMVDGRVDEWQNALSLLCVNKMILSKQYKLMGWFGGFLTEGFLNRPFSRINRVFHCKRSILGYPHLEKHPFVVTNSGSYASNSARIQWWLHLPPIGVHTRSLFGFTPPMFGCSHHGVYMCICLFTNMESEWN